MQGTRAEEIAVLAKGPKHREVQNQFLNLKELTISTADVWGSLQEKKEAAEAIISHLHR